MLEFNNDIDRALDLLYQYSPKFKKSIELIQKLSQQLKLDTFIDTDAYSHILDQPLKDENDNIIKFQRLSIAGSIILIDIDFLESTIYRVSFSLASQLDSSEPIKDTLEVLPKIEMIEDTKFINIDFNSKSINSLLNSAKLESILLKNLGQSRLNNFPKNLRYLANLDRLSTTATDLFSYNDHIGLILNSLYQIEVENNNNWLFKQGLLNTVGKVLFNNNDEIGIFIEYWQDFKYINHEYLNEDPVKLNQDQLLLGKKYNVLLDVNVDHFTQSIDYIGETRDEIWQLNDGKYQFNFTDESYLVPNKISSSKEETENIKFQPRWNLYLNLNYPIYLPINVLEFIGINHFEEAKLPEYEFFEKLNTEKELYLVNDKDEKISIKSEIHSKFIPISRISIKKLVDIPSFLKIFRNQLVLTNILHHVILQCKQREVNANNEIKSNLTKTLELANSDELNLKSLNVDDDILLDDFMNDSNFIVNEEEEDLVIKINDISYKDHDIMVSISGKNSVNFKISNGEFKLLDDTIDEKQHDFIKLLNYSEDIFKSWNFYY